MGAIQNFDNTILQFIQNNMRNDMLDVIMPIVTCLGNSGIVWILICIILLCVNKYRKYGFIMLIALLLCGFIGNITLKPLVARVRPFNRNPLVDGLLINAPRDFSFPSGHTMVSFSCSIVLYYMNKKVGLIGFFLSGLIGFSRLYLYVHYPSDVLVGCVIGIVIAWAAIKNFVKYFQRA